MAGDPKTVCMGAMMKCSMGMTPAPLVVLPPRNYMIQGLFVANIMDNKPMANISTFGMCRSLANPTVASATAAAQGVLTPMPCVPNTTAPWVPGNTQVLTQGFPTLTINSKLMCMWGGCIDFINAGHI